MNTQSVDCKRVKVPLPEGAKSEPGDFAWSFDAEELKAKQTYLYICLPGEDRMSAIEVTRSQQERAPRVWLWDGNEDKPTLQPSIHAPGQWHGFLTAGRLVSC